MWSTIGAWAMSSARARGAAGGGGRGERTRVAPAVGGLRGVRVPASRPRWLEAWRVLVWLITGKHGAEKREPGGLALFYNPLRLPYMSTTTLHLLYLLPTLCVRHVP